MPPNEMGLGSRQDVLPQDRPRPSLPGESLGAGAGEKGRGRGRRELNKSTNSTENARCSKPELYLAHAL
eukprot:8688963-Pyramimonas_sp.AAC.1